MRVVRLNIKILFILLAILITSSSAQGKIIEGKIASPEIEIDCKQPHDTSAKTESQSNRSKT